MAVFPSAAELQRERKTALREVRRRERAVDTQIEKIERRLFTLLERKSLITLDAANTLIPLWNEYLKRQGELEKGLADFLGVVGY